jgi:tRNA A37 threonylcarbamoyladenosine modification protein TsaB
VSSDDPTFSTLYSAVEYDRVKEQVVGRKVKLEQIFNTITVLTTLYAEKKKSNNRCIVTKLDAMFQQMYSGLFDPQQQVNAESLTNMCELRNLVVRLYIFKRLSNLKVFDAQFVKEHPELSQEQTIEVFLHILTHALNRLAEIYRGVQAEDADHKLLEDDLHMVALLV